MNRGKPHCSVIVNTVLNWWLSPARFCAKNFANILFFDLYNIFKTEALFSPSCRRGKCDSERYVIVPK